MSAIAWKYYKSQSHFSVRYENQFGCTFVFFLGFHSLEQRQNIGDHDTRMSESDLHKLPDLRPIYNISDCENVRVMLDLKCWFYLDEPTI